MSKSNGNSTPPENASMDGALPPAWIDEAIAWRGSWDDNRYDFGDWLIARVDEAPRGQRTKAMSELATYAGLHKSQAYAIVKVCRAFQGQQREEFCEALTVDELAACAAAPDPYYAARWAVESADQFGGRIAGNPRIAAQVRIWKGGRDLTVREQCERKLRIAARAFAFVREHAREAKMENFAWSVALKAIEQQLEPPAEKVSKRRNGRVK